MDQTIQLLDGKIAPVKFGEVSYVDFSSKHKVVREFETNHKYEMQPNLVGRQVCVSTDGKFVAFKPIFLSQLAKQGDDIFFVALSGMIIHWGSMRFYNRAATQIALSTPLLPPLPEPVVVVVETVATPPTPAIGWKCPHVRPSDLKGGEVLITMG